MDGTADTKACTRCGRRDMMVYDNGLCTRCDDVLYGYHIPQQLEVPAGWPAPGQVEVVFGKPEVE